MTTELSRIFDIVERWAATTPDCEALAFGERSWTWAQLDERVRRAAGALRAAGLGPGDRLAVLDKNHPACLELTLAASLIGAANVVVNFRLAPEELAFVLDDSAARVVVVGAEFAAALATVRDLVNAISAASPAPVPGSATRTDRVHEGAARALQVPVLGFLRPGAAAQRVGQGAQAPAAIESRFLTLSLSGSRTRSWWRARR